MQFLPLHRTQRDDYGAPAYMPEYPGTQKRRLYSEKGLEWDLEINLILELDV